MSLINKPNIFYPGITISSDEAIRLEKGGQLKHFTIEDENGKLVNGGHFFMDDVRTLSPLTPLSAEKYHYITSIKQNLSTVMGIFKLYPTPQTNNFMVSDDVDFTDVNGQLIVLGNASSSPNYQQKLEVKMHTASESVSLFDIQCIWWEKDLLYKMISSQDKSLLDVTPSLSSLKYTHTLGLDNDRTRLLQSNLAKVSGVRPSKISYFLLMPAVYFQSDKGIESIIRNYIRNGAEVRDGNHLLNHLKTILNVLSTDPVLKIIKNGRERVSAIHRYAVENLIELDMAIKRELIELNSSHRAFQFYHYDRIENTVLMSSKSGLVRFNPHEWVTSTDRSIVNDLKNARHHNLLPEVKSYERNKNRNDKIINSAALVGNCTVSEVSLQRVAQNLQIPPIEPKVTLTKSNIIKSYAPSISFHETHILEPILYKGYFEGVPSMDNKFSQKLIALMENEFAAKLSGIQYKLPMLLRPKSGKYELQRQVNNQPFTHIAKFPMPNYEDITLAEWLALYLIDNSLVLESAQTTLVAFDGDVGMDNMPQSIIDSFSNDHLSSSNTEQLRDELEELFNTQVFSTSKVSVEHPPFVLSTRFDIPNSGEHIQIKAHDFSELLLRGPEEKYNADFEDVGYWITENISDPKQRKAACLDTIKQLYCSYILHNNDLHLKNLTLLEVNDLDSGQTSFKVSPCYDVIITPLVYFNSDSMACYQSALPVNGQKFPTVNDLVECASNAFDMSKIEAKLLFEQVCTDIKDSIVALKMSMPPEIENRPRWKDVVTKGLNIVNRNIRYIEANDKSYTAAPINVFDNNLTR